jgi:hypothetical protein
MEILIRLKKENDKTSLMSHGVIVVNVTYSLLQLWLVFKSRPSFDMIELQLFVLKIGFESELAKKKNETEYTH